MESVTSIQDTTYQISRPSPEARPADGADQPARPAVEQPAVESPDRQETEEQQHVLQSEIQEHRVEAEARPEPEDMKEQIQEISRELHALTNENHDVSLVWKDELDKTVIEVREKESGDLIAQWPSEEAVNVSMRFRQMLGTIVDRKS